MKETYVPNNFDAWHHLMHQAVNVQCHNRKHFKWLVITNVHVQNLLKNTLISIRKDQQHALICTTPLFYVLAPTCFGSSLPSSGSFLDPPELIEIQIEWVVYHIMCDYVTSHNHTLYYIPPIPFVFQVTQVYLRSSLMMAGYCQNM
jgi:hypothetical protein